MRYAVLVGTVLLLAGAVFVWFRGASRAEEVVEDELDRDRGAGRRVNDEPRRPVVVSDCGT